MELLLAIVGYFLLGAFFLVFGSMMLGPALVGYGVAQSRGARVGFWAGVLALAVLVLVSLLGWVPVWYWTVMVFASIGFAWHERRKRRARELARRAAITERLQDESAARVAAGTPSMTDRLGGWEMRARHRARHASQRLERRFWA